MTKWLLFLFAMVFVPGVNAEGIDALTITTNADGTQDYSVTLQVLAIMTAMSFIPAAIIMMTSFTRIIVVLAILRQAIGLQQTPSNQVLLGMSLFLSIFIMAPIYEQINERAIEPYLSEQVTSLEALDLAKEPMKAFMLSQVRIKDLETFAKIAGYDQLDSPEATPMVVLIPAFVTSELQTAFIIGFMFFIPFLIVDLVVASVLMAMGMMMLSPMIVSLPFKIMLFVLVDGWSLVMGTLAKSFGLGT
ncbi:MAG: flagellar biosynthetic protein FliP [Pseudoalteromonas tetraodonis]|jgi:flagellar biosynthetic protein FliP|uniref:Flagellar biosynthetic protein FliP n=4 Tax=Pseudoalteromonas TaxID=53246 RepID=A0A9W4QSS7_PSEHA|nr:MULTISPECIES: flagellar type III secretion system pore protein FliP [Pseudoalteromonas]MAY59376.1 flagellar biosynthetic protein FliP [Pseudoalteromonas sp.]ADT69161.1 flagellar biosynthesis protein FliP [Pseudoalteromonas sp. SM9913]ALQ55466.1 Flagellar biosynthesis protein FliP [Pseudoalteromonas issachenkonii]ATC91319.1 flagellar biosynthetic protein FliP [Pseudoalteromonas issachenkonii]ATD03874.1 flagellar biosynthetic protein FliP [Pseudoalteromonas tetraodonis]|tara:strand:- start:842 stop:1582 length:741 start_codon:yes stop_codon:yes gene_type:complete